jgi:hypothetical protein
MVARLECHCRLCHDTEHARILQGKFAGSECEVSPLIRTSPSLEEGEVSREVQKHELVSNVLSF